MLRLRLRPFSIAPWLKLLSTLGLFSLLPSCICHVSTSVDVPNAQFTYLSEASAQVYATQFQFLVNPGVTTDISLAQWTSQSKGQLCMPLDNWTSFNTMISGFCSAPGIDCDYQISADGTTLKQALNNFAQALSQASGRALPRIE